MYLQNAVFLTHLGERNGLLVKRPKFFVDAERKLKLLQQRVSKKRIGSNNWKKAQRKVASLHEYVANCRKDWHRKLSHKICDNAAMVFVEDLNLSAYLVECWVSIAWMQDLVSSLISLSKLALNVMSISKK